MKVDNLVSVDYNMQQEIYESGYAHNNKCWFSDWNILPNVDDVMIEISKSTFAYHFINHLLSKDENYIYDSKNFSINSPILFQILNLLEKYQEHFLLIFEYLTVFV